ncbi:response regulator [Saccharospirillum sp. MSK14-1]|uniref:response regulator n=1 Tax=Saccharospirillum sp. MSK14-1 TaxID=1897632 RepID=UPI00351A1C33
MVVDDSASIRQVVVSLKSQGYNVVVAKDGADALTKLDGTSFQLVITDVNMPNMDGITLLKEIKQKPGHAQSRS